MKKYIILIIFVILISALVIGVFRKRHSGIRIIGCTFEGEPDPNSEIIILDAHPGFIIENCTFIDDPNDPNEYYITIGID